MTSILRAESLDAWYGTIHALQGVDVEVRRGEAVALMGRNGMGKTTLLRALMGLVPQRRGRIALGERDMSRAAPEAMSRAGIALVPEGRGVFASLSVVENLTMAARPGRDGRRNWTLDRVYALFPRLIERRRNRGDQLSGGEQQMLTIGRALMTNPDLIMIDEATEGLAPKIADTIWDTISNIRADGIATVVVDKNFKALSRLCDRSILLSKGRVVFDGTPGDLGEQRALLDRHLGI